MKLRTDDLCPSLGCDNRLGGAETAAMRGEARRGGAAGARLAGGRAARRVGGRQVAGEGW